MQGTRILGKWPIRDGYPEHPGTTPKDYELRTTWTVNDEWVSHVLESWTNVWDNYFPHCLIVHGEFYKIDMKFVRMCWRTPKRSLQVRSVIRCASSQKRGAWQIRRFSFAWMLNLTISIRWQSPEFDTMSLKSNDPATSNRGCYLTCIMPF